MVAIKEPSTQTDQSTPTVDFRDHATTYLSGVRRPSFLYDRSTYTRLKYGEYDMVEQQYRKMQEAYRTYGYLSDADDLAIIELPPNQKFVDCVFQSDGEFQRFVQSLKTKSK